MVCLHATDPATVYLSAWARVDGMSVGDVDDALYSERSLVKHLAMRRTLFVLPRDALALAQAARAPAWPMLSAAGSYATSRRRGCTATVGGG